MRNRRCLSSNSTMYSSIGSISFGFSLSQTTRALRPSTNTVSPTLNLGISGRSAVHSTAHASRLGLGFFDEDCLITQSLAVENGDRLVGLGLVFQLDVAKCRRHTCDKISNNPDGASCNSTRLHPFLQLMVGTVVGDIHE